MAFNPLPSALSDFEIVALLQARPVLRIADQLADAGRARLAVIGRVSVRTS
jgi:hypothetical protein